MARAKEPPPTTRPPTPVLHRQVPGSIVEPPGALEALATEGSHVPRPCRRNDDKRQQKQRTKANRVFS